MLAGIKSILTHPLVKGLDIDDPTTNEKIDKLIREKAFLNQIYSSWYKEIVESLPENLNGSVVELGSGGGFLKEFIPDLITSEILQVPRVDLVLDGTQLAFKQSSLRAIVMVDVFHHIPDVEKFIADALYCIKPGGVIVMIEPWITRWSQFIFSHLHHEPADVKTQDWMLSADGGPLSTSNQALPWIVFKRDIQKFKKRYPEWRIRKIRLHSPFSYLVSGGVSLRSFLPGSFYKPFVYMERLSMPFMHAIAMFATITIEK